MAWEARIFYIQEGETLSKVVPLDHARSRDEAWNHLRQALVWSGLTKRRLKDDAMKAKFGVILKQNTKPILPKRRPKASIVASSTPFRPVQEWLPLPNLEPSLEWAGQLL